MNNEDKLISLALAKDIFLDRIIASYNFNNINTYDKDYFKSTFLKCGICRKLKYDLILISYCIDYTKNVYLNTSCLVCEDNFIKDLLLEINIKRIIKIFKFPDEKIFYYLNKLNKINKLLG